jgi:hypothetical protein
MERGKEGKLTRLVWIRKDIVMREFMQLGLRTEEIIQEVHIDLILSAALLNSVVNGCQGIPLVPFLADDGVESLLVGGQHIYHVRSCNLLHPTTRLFSL